MILNAFVNALLNGIGTLVALLPEWPIPQVDGAVTSLVAPIDGVVPALLVFRLVVAGLGLQLLLWVWDGTVWVYHQVWGSS